MWRLLNTALAAIHDGVCNPTAIQYDAQRNTFPFGCLQELAHKHQKLDLSPLSTHSQQILEMMNSGTSKLICAFCWEGFSVGERHLIEPATLACPSACFRGCDPLPPLPSWPGIYQVTLHPSYSFCPPEKCWTCGLYRKACVLFAPVQS